MRETRHRMVRERRHARARKRRAPVALVIVFASLVFVVASSAARKAEAQPESKVEPPERIYPKEIRGYKVERARVEIKRPRDSKQEDADSSTSSPNADEFIHFGQPRIVSTTPLRMTLEVPVTLSAVKQEGQVHFLTFEDVVVNGMPVTVDDYEHRFNLPTHRPVMLAEPVRLHITTANALRGALGELSKPKDVWPVTGRVYVFGRFNKFFFSFKRVVPIELSLTLPNPLKSKQTAPAFKQ